MASYTQDYVDYVRAIQVKTGGELHVENRVSIDRIVPGGFGTSDAIIVTEDTIYVIDLKYGKGIRVNAVNGDKPNPQAMCYATGAFDEHDFGTIQNIELAIVQPRLDHISEHSVTADELNEWVEDAHSKFLKTTVKNPERTPSDKGCQWCKGKAQCKPYIDMNMSVLVEDFADFEDSVEALEEGELKDPNIMSLEDLVKITQHASGITKLLSTIKDKLFDTAMEGGEVPGHKLVLGNKKRVFKDEDAALKAFTRKFTLEVVAPRKLLTPPQIEKLKDKNGKTVKGTIIFNNHVSILDGKPLLVPDTDKRETYIVDTADSDFDDFEDADVGDFDGVEDSDEFGLEKVLS